LNDWSLFLLRSRLGLLSRFVFFINLKFWVWFLCHGLVRIDLDKMIIIVNLISVIYNKTSVRRILFRVLFSYYFSISANLNVFYIKGFKSKSLQFAIISFFNFKVKDFSINIKFIPLFKNFSLYCIATSL
jgi:hypothetical protein